MAEDEGKDSGTPETGGAKTFTQEELDDIVKERVRQEKERSNKAVDEAVAKALAKDKEKQRIEALQGEERLRAEFEAKIQASESDAKDKSDRLASALRDLAVYKATTELAKLDLPTEVAPQMIGEDEAATKRNIEAFSKAFNEAVNKRVAESIAKGAPNVGGQPGEEAWKTDLRKAFGL